MTDRVFNYCAGPSTLPLPVLEKAKAELLSWRGEGLSVMEMNHRGPLFSQILAEAKADFAKLLSIPDTHAILFMQGGATAQFAAVPMNLLGDKGKADYIVSGNFSKIAAAEAEKYCKVNIIASSADRDFTYIPKAEDLRPDPDAAYMHYCSNNTVFGTAFSYIPESGDVPLVADMSSEILSKPVPVSRYGLIYGGAQKNIGPAGVTFLILDKSLLGKAMDITPTQLNYSLTEEKDSLWNTPPTFSIYMLGLTLKWLIAEGGVEEMAKRKKERGRVIYDLIDNSTFYTPRAEVSARSDMNICFKTPSAELDQLFIKTARAKGLFNLHGHKVAGGLRASLYNAMTMEGTYALAEFMKEFERENV